MGFGWIVLAIVGVVLLFAILHVLSKVASEHEAAKRRKQAASVHPLADDTITYAGHS